MLFFPRTTDWTETKEISAFVYTLSLLLGGSKLTLSAIEVDGKLAETHLNILNKGRQMYETEYLRTLSYVNCSKNDYKILEKLFSLVVALISFRLEQKQKL